MRDKCPQLIKFPDSALLELHSNFWGTSVSLGSARCRSGGVMRNIPSPGYDQTEKTAFSERVDPPAIVIWRSTDWLSSPLLPLYRSPSGGNVRRAPKNRTGGNH